MIRTSALFLVLCLGISAFGQNVTFTSTSVPYKEALDTALANNVLTHDAVPFHAVLTIAPKDASADPKLSGKVDLYWAAKDRYRLVLDTPDFGQTLIVNGSQVQETDRGDFYPNWLKKFATALLDPMPRFTSVYDHPTGVIGGPGSFGSFMQPCVRLDDRPHNLTDQMTWASICFDNSQPQLAFVIDFTYSMEFADFRSFHAKEIASTYTTSTGDYTALIGHLVTLDDWQPDDALLTVSAPTPAQGRILTTFVSTAKEETMLESAAKDVSWPTVRNGPAQGYMIVQAVTDRTGQVRETSKHNSDNAELESYGRMVALKYKFKPLLVDGAPQQMIMPLVLHFSTKPGEPIPEFDDTESRKRITGCDVPRQIRAPAFAGQQIVLSIGVTEDGHFGSIANISRSLPVWPIFQLFSKCHFALYEENGKPTPYHANINVTAR